MKEHSMVKAQNIEESFSFETSNSFITFNCGHCNSENIFHSELKLFGQGYHICKCGLTNIISSIYNPKTGDINIPPTRRKL